MVGDMTSDKIDKQTRRQEGKQASKQTVTSKQGLTGDECNHTTTNPLRASSMAKPRTREANTSIKYRSMHRHANRVIQTFDMGLGVRTVTKSIRPRSGPNY